ncbi:MAG: hypothetical protein RR205_05495, partial [Oscillospiraceae bacterium]
YTQDLIHSIPKSGSTSKRLVTIPGSPPSLNKPIVGCSYAPRCSRSTEKCFKVAPALCKQSETHLYACHLSQLTDEQIHEMGQEVL